MYSVISPEGCAAILWRDRAQGPRAAEALKITAADCMRLGVIDDIISEPLGGAHRHQGEIIASVGDTLAKHLGELRGLSREALRSHRYERFRRLGQLVEIVA